MGTYQVDEKVRQGKPGESRHVGDSMAQEGVNSDTDLLSHVIRVGAGAKSTSWSFRGTEFSFPT